MTMTNQEHLGIYKQRGVSSRRKNNTTQTVQRMTFYDMPIKVFIPLCIPLIVSAFIWDNIPVQLIGAIAVIFTFAILLGETGERLPIWNKYLGGGATFCLITMCILASQKLLPKTVLENATGFMTEYNFLTLYVSVIIVGSIMGINRKEIFKSLGLYIPTIISCIVGSSIFGILVGFLFGKTPLTILTQFVFPMLGGGIAAGAIPMSQIYHEITGLSTSAFLSHSVSIITMGNLIAIVLAVAYDLLGKKFPRLTSNGTLMKSNTNIAENEEKVSLTPTTIVASFFVVSALFMTANLISTKLLPSIMGVPIHTFGYLIVLVALLNAVDFLPTPLKFACTEIQKAFGGRLGWMMMTGVGIALIDVSSLISVLNVETISIVFSIVFGGSIFAGLFGTLVNFYFIESAMTAGLCMTDMGGAGDLAILGAANRLELMSFSSVSTRVGAAIILLLASIAFTFI